MQHKLLTKDDVTAIQKYIDECFDAALEQLKVNVLQYRRFSLDVSKVIYRVRYSPKINDAVLSACKDIFKLKCCKIENDIITFILNPQEFPCNIQQAWRLNFALKDLNLHPVITADYFKGATGHDPKEDDLERCNCPCKGKLGHKSCGWNPYVNLPKFMSSYGIDHN